MKDKKYQVFISSTYTDLIEERRKVLDVLLMADCIPAGMEAFVATDNEQFEVIKKVIDLCDYYILILGMRYGSISPTTGISYTEMEYEYAKEKGIPVLVFAIDDTISISEEKCESDQSKIEKLRIFRAKALENRLASLWKNSDDLSGKVAISIMRAKTEIERPGWQRAVDYDEASLRKQIMDLTSTNKELQQKLTAAQKTIKELTSTTDIAFEECTFEIKYKYSVSQGKGTAFSSKTYSSSQVIPLPEIFEAIATEMMDVMIGERNIESVIKTLINCSHSVYLEDKLVIKRILNQLKQLNLLHSSWSEKNKVLYWGLTQKGIKVRDDRILIKNTD